MGMRDRLPAERPNEGGIAGRRQGESVKRHRVRHEQAVIRQTAGRGGQITAGSAPLEGTACCRCRWPAGGSDSGSSSRMDAAMALLNIA